MVQDIIKSKSANVIKNGTILTACSKTGKYSSSNLHVSNSPTITDIENKYDNRFYNGIFVQLTGGQTIIGG